VLKRVLFIFFSLFLTVFSYSQTATINDEIDERVYLLKDLEFFIDTTNQLTFSQITESINSPRFQKNSNYQNKDYQTGDSYWIRFSVKHNSNSNKVWLIEFYDQTIDSIEAYLPLAAGGYEKKIMGDHYPFSLRKFAHKNFEIQLTPSGDSVQTYYFKVRSDEFADIRIAFRSVDRLIYYALNEYFLYGTFYGMILIISLYNFLIFLAVREIKYIYYICYIISVAFYALSLDGIGFQYIWPSHPEWNDYLSGVFLYLLILWALVFTRRFLSTRARARKLDDALKWMIALRTFIFLIELFFYPQFFAFRFIEILPLSLIFYTGIYVWQNGYKPARYFVIAYGLLLVGFFLRTLVFFNIIVLTTVSHYSLHFSFVVEMLFLTFALGDRVTILKDNRDRAMRRIIHQHEVNMMLKDKVTRELEQKVAERTNELNSKNTQLEEINNKLQKQTREINQINSVLDLDNWKLKNKIKVVLEERLMEKTMSYEEFKTLYPDTLSCYRFLETLKWEQGFSCTKCKNDKYFEGTQKFARRCTRCGYNESITANTIFQGVKFPIEKAFFITYLVVAGRKTHTLESLASILELRTNTVWSFKQKVQRQLTWLEQKGAVPVASRWQEIIITEQAEEKEIIN
jgi:hypothetical protein